MPSPLLQQSLSSDCRNDPAESVPHGVTAPLYNTTLPLEHSWNAGVSQPDDVSPDFFEEIDATIPADTASAPPGIPSDAVETDTASCITAVVYIPAFFPEVHKVRIEVPCGVDQATGLVAGARRGDNAMYFPTLFPVAPQPFSALAIFVASPEWQTSQPIVFFDCSRVNQTLFACAVSPSLTRESILLAAGRGPHEQYAVYVHGLSQPLQQGQRISLANGMLISLVPVGYGAPATYELADSLLDAACWHADPDLPGPSVIPGRHFWVLTDALPICFTVGDGRRPHFKDDLAALLDTQPHRLSILRVTPRVVDGFYRGFFTPQLLVATERVSRLPMPPARPRFLDTVVVLDCRYILQAFTWRIVRGAEISVQSLVNEFQHLCPERYIVSITGAPVANRPAGAVFLLHDGCVLVVAFIENLLPSDASDESLPPFDGGPPAPEDPDDSGDGPRRSSRTDDPRSRSPPLARTSTVLNIAGPHHTARHSTQPHISQSFGSVVPSGHFGTWLSVSMHDALAESLRIATPAILPACGVCLASPPPPTVSQRLLALLEHVTGDARLPGLHLSNLLCSLQGFSWFVARTALSSRLALPGPGPALAATIAPADRVEEVTAEEPSLIIAASFCILVPEYQPECLSLQLSIPQDIVQATQAVDAARDPARRRMFPALVPVAPQPDIRWGTLLAAPAWLQDRIIVCFDLYALDGRVFALCTPAIVDPFWLRYAAGIPSQLQVTILHPVSRRPIAEGEEIRLRLGDCLTFQEGQVCSEPVLTLSDMLRTHLPWAHGPPFPSEDAAIRSCLVADHVYTDFELRPERAVHYKADIAARTHLRTQRLSLQPSIPHPSDAALNGRSCGSVIAASENHRHTPDRVVVGLIDCPPLLSGWRLLSTAAGWVLLETVLRGLNEAAPTGWHASLNCPSHWTWLWVQPGQVFTAVFQPDSHCNLVYPAQPAEPCDDDHGSPPRPDTARDHDLAGPLPGAAPPPEFACTGARQGGAGGARSAQALGLSLCFALTLHLGLWCTELSTAFLCCFFCLSGMPRRHALAGVFVFTLCAPRTCAATTELSCSFRIAPEDHARIQVTTVPELTRPVATPARAAQHSLPRAPGGPCAPHTASSASPPLVIDEPLQTLLEQSLATDPGAAFLETRALLEVLFEVADTARAEDSIAAKTLVSLEAQLAPSLHQQAALRLERCLPHAMPVEEHDWLDSDLTEVLAFKALPLEVRTGLVNIPLWHQSGCPVPDRIDVYTDGSAASDATDITPCAWAFAVFIVSHGRSFLLGHAAAQSAPPSTPYHLGEVQEDALTAELLALCWALCWASQHSLAFQVPLCFWYDAQSAGRGTFGAAKPVQGSDPTHYASLAKFAVAIRQYLNSRRPVSHAHVAGHSGCLGNELCDALTTGAYRRGLLCGLPILLPTGLGPPFPDSPTSLGCIASMSKSPLVPCFLNTLLKPLPRDYTRCATQPRMFTSVSFNVLTLREPQRQPARSENAGLRILGRKDLLKSSLEPQHPLFVGLQETRLPQSETQPDADFWIFNTEATPQGTGGCALWISKHVPFYTSQGNAFFIRRGDVTIVGTSSRHLVANISTPRIRLQVFVLHAPSVANVPVEEVRHFWDLRTQEVLRRPDGAHFLILCDANSRLGDITSEHVGDHGAEVEGVAGEMFHEFLCKIDVIAPATWGRWHTGPHYTWCSPTGLHSRIDYVVVPKHWHTASMHSFTLPNVELMQLRDDHAPVVLQCHFMQHAPAMSYTSVRKKVVRPVGDAATKQTASKLLTACVPVTSWGTDVDPHYQALAQAWYQVGSQLETPTDTPSRQPYITPATLDLVRERRELRPQLRVVTAARQHRWLLIVFAAFVCHASDATFSEAQLRTAERWLREADHVEAITLASYRRLTFALRRAVAFDRVAYLDGLAAEVAAGSLGDPKVLYRTLRRAFPAAKPSRRRSIEPLPALLLQDGTFAQSTEERGEAWRSHFAQQEAGVAVDEAGYAKAFDNCHLQTRELDVAMLPSLPAIETHVLTAKTAKAAGPDGITAELLRMDAPLIARQILPVFLKSCLRVREPTLFVVAISCVWQKRQGRLFLAMHTGPY